MKKIQLFDPVVDKIKTLVGSDKRAKQELFFALQAINESKDLNQCSEQSLMMGVFNALNAGLSLNPTRGEACLIARWDGRTQGKKAQFMPMYKGLIKLMKSHSGVTRVISNVFYEQDTFEVNLADDERPVTHVPCIECTRDDDKIKGAYAVVTFDDGMKSVELMTVSQINEIREKSDSVIAFRAGKLKKPPPWIGNYSEMCRKTVLRRIFKYTPEVVSEKMTQAIKTDDEDYSVTQGQIGYIENLLPTANIAEKYAEEIGREMDTYSQAAASECIEFLKLNQLNGVRDTGTGQAKTTLKQSIEESVENPKT